MLRKGDHFDDDFVRARRKLIVGAARRVDRDAELSDRIAYVAEYGLQPSYYNTLLQQIAAVAPAQIKALIASELDPNSEIIVVLGDRAAPREGVRGRRASGRQDHRARVQVARHDHSRSTQISSSTSVIG